MNINSTLTVDLNTVESLALGFASQNVQSETKPALTLTPGTAAGQADLHWELTGVTLAASGTVTYTLSALTDSLGRPVALAGVRYLLISVTSRTAADYLTVGNAGTHPWSAPFDAATDTIKVFDLLLLAATADKYAVVAATTDQLKIVNSGTHPITFNIAAVGTSV